MSAGFDTFLRVLETSPDRLAATFDATSVVRERDPESWGDVADDDITLWRRAGFTAGAAQEWLYLAGIEGATRVIALASAWRIAGFTCSQAEEWIFLALDLEPDELVVVASEWHSAGFEARAAYDWLSREDVVDAAAYVSAGWTLAQRDLLDILCGDETIQAIAGERFSNDTSLPSKQEVVSRVLAFGTAPVRALDYIRAGVPLSDWPAFERMWAQGIDMSELLARYGEQVHRSFSDNFRAQWVATTSKPGHYHQAAYLPERYWLAPTTFQDQVPLGDDWVPPRSLGGWEDEGVEVEFLPNGRWEQGGAPEDFAHQPRLDWDEAQRARVIAALSTDLEVGEELMVEWPPTASLWTAGEAFDAEAEPCGEHEDFLPICRDCKAPAEEPDHYLAEFHWHVEVTVYEPKDGELVDVDHRGEHIATMYMDPRLVEYSPWALR